ncbi:glycosyltransferase [Glutamicibacter protophormiae]|nr:glycosyltransferase [Glutamicibacter protophormiae]
MSRFLLAATPFAGHVQPMIGLARSLRRRGHHITFYTGAKYSETVDAASVTFLPFCNARDFDDGRPEDTFPAMARASGFSAMLTDFRELFFGTAPGQAQDMLDAHDQIPFDAVVAEGTCFGAELFHELRGVPYATASLSPLGLPSRYLPPPGVPLRPGRTAVGRFRDAVLRAALDRTLDAAFRRLHNEARAAAGLKPTRRNGLYGAWSQQLLVAQGVPAVEPPRPDLPAHVHFVGDLAAGTRGTARPPEWLESLDPNRPVVHVTEGTVERDKQSLVERVVEALHGGSVQLVVGGKHHAGILPDSVIAADWVPQDLLFPKADLFITNGGYGAMMAALSHGVPVLAVPPSAEKWVGAGNVARSGAGLRLRPAAATPSAIAQGVEELLGDPGFRRAASSVANDMSEAGGPERAADLCEALITPEAPSRLR